MKVMMLGWEYPPQISGGLGTACEGLTRALARLQVDIDFVVPHAFGNEQAAHMTMLASDTAKVSGGPPARRPEEAEAIHSFAQETMLAAGAGQPGATRHSGNQRAGMNVFRIAAKLDPYARTDTSYRAGKPDAARPDPRFGRKGVPEDGALACDSDADPALPIGVAALLNEGRRLAWQQDRQGGDLFTEVARYTARIVALASPRAFDLIHAHDWMTFAAGVALKAATSRPLILHVHSLEYDRAGEHGDWRIERLEKECMTAADSLIAVSHYTRELIHQRHGIPLDKIAVVHNGVYAPSVRAGHRRDKRWAGKIVLFLGRITFQKGPDYFVEAAARVLPRVPDVLFIMAGSGDMLPRMIDRVEELGIARHFLFTGFLNGREVEKMFSLADLYVMPSVSEPFGITALEAISCHTPTIISRQSGVSEVVNHALKVDFWDVDGLANLIMSVLKYPELKDDMVTYATEEVQHLRWDAAARKTLQVYGWTQGAVPVGAQE